MLFSLEDEFDIVFEEVDILSDPNLYERFKFVIPVMIIDEKVKLMARIDVQKLRRALAEGYGPAI